jgi:glucose-6-phosphate-specific signal transduction histidine kinase
LFDHLLRIVRREQKIHNRANVDSLGRLRFLRLELRDDGCGFDPAKRYDGFGLLGIKERVESMGGELTVQSAPENGTAILVVLPLMAPSHA